MSMAIIAGAVTPGLLTSIGVPLVTGLLGANDSAKGQTTTQQQTLDPRIAKYLYGANGEGGLMGNTSDLYQKQLAQGGLNPMQNAGLEMQRQAYTDPRYGQSYSNMRDVGMGLMNGGAAGNPFMQGGRMGQPQNLGIAAPQAPQQAPQQQTSAAYQPIAQTPQAPAYQPPAQQAQPDMEAMMQEYMRNNPYQQYGADRGEAGGGR